MLQEFVESISKIVDSKINEIHTTMPGKIVSFDAKTGLATVLPAMKFKLQNGTTVDYPKITGVPVVFPQGNGQKATIAYPVKAGDGCLIFIAEHSIEYWLYGQETNTDLSFDLTDAFCIPGLFKTANPLVDRACKENAVITYVDGTEVVAKKGEVAVNAANIVLNADGTKIVTNNGEVSVKGANIVLNSDGTEVVAKKGEVAVKVDKTEVITKNGEVAVKAANIVLNADGTEVVTKKGEVTVKGASIVLDGNLQVNGNVTVSGEIQSSTATAE